MARYEGKGEDPEVVVDGVDVRVTDTAVGDGHPNLFIPEFGLFVGERLEPLSGGPGRVTSDGRPRDHGASLH
jgi:hypothetical protein